MVEIRLRSLCCSASTVAAESNGHVLVDATDFFLRDGHGAGRFAASRSLSRRQRPHAIYMARTKAFPKNTTEIEVELTFSNEAAGGRGGGGGGPVQGPLPIGGRAVDAAVVWGRAAFFLRLRCQRDSHGRSLRCASTGSLIAACRLLYSRPMTRT